MTNKLIAVAAAALISGCSSVASMKSVDQAVQVEINADSALTLTKDSAVEKEYNTTSFGQYKFKAKPEAGGEPMYGLIPLKFNGGYLAADILFFAPAMFFNLREFYPFYEFDFAQGEVKYKKNEQDNWMIYRPSPEEVEHAKTYFKKIGKS
ncbi:hypothetical protein G3R49_01365 [Shewanella sp. WXL01]|uniref:Lipoprotein n=1 Tax=Shewanella maritima TaxID=2520507 RepID=A0A411PH19_9GAMM|nr:MULTISPECIES: hypothetical protein [Shewanella]NKF49226.1 hypothetical protein [Shewanella sp. WXL01]QBF82660.1 hypothetical protein EXU30_08140 [Shewanella maritima]